ncbi:glycine betaine ABC transporter substrate-binding protein [Szabonella alba]|uniref:ABC-type glycine betaine transport system substrate-binding domain-containing protein n=1 Tax=Szabonella alba TaxID=2804194 RepID=A0A8K0VC89_9RHOB|nr:glycine betaine ABC transporter substrate-binding protein [Szabonella alba]MBL4919417.1 hypothetical protein [Szabonella alba]
MKKTAMAAFFGAALPNTSHADCCEVSITEMTFASAINATEITAFLMDQGYGCTATRMPYDTSPALTLLSMNNELEIVTELWVSSAGDACGKPKADGVMENVVKALEPGKVEAWWSPAYSAENHPELNRTQGKLTRKVSFQTDQMRALLTWQGKGNSSTAEATVHFLQGDKKTWTG